ncbi:MAG: FecR domain-containing protein [Pseudomonadota bacterium]
MSNVIHFNSRDKRAQEVREKACLWIVKLSAGASERELQEIHAWLDENPEHIRVLQSVACLWDQVSVLSELSDIFPLEEYVPARPHPARRGFIYSALVVVVIFIFMQSPMLTWLDARLFQAAGNTMQMSYETRIGQQSTVVLPDGSEVLLNTNSRVEVTFSSVERNIVLHRGEAQFTVTKDKARPFRVHANGGIVEAVGTMFTVQQTLSKKLEVTVLEGVVNFTRTKEPALNQAAQQEQQATPDPTPGFAAIESIPLSAGESVEVEETSDEILKQTFQPEELATRLAWRDGMLLFEGDPLAKVIEEVSRYTSIQIDVDEAARDIQVLGLFRTGDIEGVLLAMQDTFNLTVERLSDDHIVLRSDNQEL